ncbi:hypothetical protein INT47_006412 [Mucor saturninus]|uniref:Dymeclin n=1 Tax=Mucor saturninus TaxID=64648 RepID=A0A8H7RHV9_9FUNG|nr:hypothetical protein INT47_006412 [Mucor saturninus]
MNSNIPPLTAPNKTLTAPRRPSNYNTPRSPSVELSDSFSAFTATTPVLTSPTKFTSHYKQPTEQHNHFFSPSQLASIKPICSSSKVSDWDFLATEKYPASHNPQDAYDLEMTSIGLSIELAANNTRTRNFNKLLAHLVDLLRQLQTTYHESIPIETYNTLFLVRVFTKQFAGNLTNKEIIAQFEEDATHTRGEDLIEALLYVLINMDPNSNYPNYEFYTEVLNTFLVLCSTQLQHARLTDDNYFLGILTTKFGNRAEAVVARLLENLIEQRTPPPQSSSGVMLTAYNYFFSSRTNSSPDADTMPVADRSLLLLLLLGTQSISPHDTEWVKSYRFAIANLSDHHVLSSDVDGCDRKMHLISFKDLFEIFSKSLHVEERMLLFYLILVENESFRVYVLSRTDQETIYLPILKLIYESMEGKTNYSQVYILMIVLLILSQDDVNNEAIGKIIVHNITWFTERPLLKSISLGGLMTLVLIRTLQLNLSHQKDIYLHTNCLAILANMSTTMTDMHAYVAQRIVSLFELLARRYTKLVEKDSSADAIVYEELLALLLEMMNATLTHRLKHNSQLVYALLQKREIFTPFQLHERFADLVQNVEQVIRFFHARVSEANLKAPSSNEVLRLIEQASRTWSNSKLVSLPDLKFQYEEEQDSFEFFIPYIWALVQRRTFIYWSEEKSHVLDNYHMMNTME